MCYFTAEVMTDIDVLVPLFKLEIEMFQLHFSGRVRHTWLKSCWIDHIYELTALECQHKVVITKLLNVYKPWVSKLRACQTDAINAVSGIQSRVKKIAEFYVSSQAKVT